MAQVAVGDEHTCVLRYAHPTQHGAHSAGGEDGHDAPDADTSNHIPSDTRLPTSTLPLDQERLANHPPPQPLFSTACWGSNSSAQLDTPSLDPSLHFTLVASGGAHNCAQFRPHPPASGHHARDVVCWGSDSQGQASLPAALRVGTLQLSLGT